MTYYVLFVIELATRKVRIAGFTTHPDANWMLQDGTASDDPVDSILVGKRYLILDRDTEFCGSFRAFLVERPPLQEAKWRYRPTAECRVSPKQTSSGLPEKPPRREGAEIPTA